MMVSYALGVDTVTSPGRRGRSRTQQGSRCTLWWCHSSGACVAAPAWTLRPPVWLAAALCTSAFVSWSDRTMNLVVQQEVTFDPGLQTPQCPWRTDCHKDASVASWNLHCVPLPLVIERQSQVFHVVFPLLQQFLHMFLLRCPQTLHMLEVNTPCLNPLTLPLLKFLPQTLQHRQEVSELA